MIINRHLNGIKKHLISIHNMFIHQMEKVNLIQLIKGECLRLMNDYQQALEWYQKALDINPQYVQSLHGKAYCLMQYGQYGDAQLLLENAYQLSPDNKLIEELLCIYTHLNKFNVSIQINKNEYKYIFKYMLKSQNIPQVFFTFKSFISIISQNSIFIQIYNMTSLNPSENR
ncbi:unnamed protein product [Paramecium primaurelia]|uniref:Tetratricopeptide repeat protein n=1 Tax=Paramecium primaurelia TaxID=5886 RepID=A0A8S1MUC4_PARPR|nr:unnamed protein product [Paramecium primaurelia]